MLHQTEPQKLPYHIGNRLPEPPGTYGCLHVCHATCKTAAQTSPSLAGLSVSNRSHQRGHASFFSDQYPPLLAETAGSLHSGTFLQTVQLTVPSYGCISNGVGRSFREAQDSRSLVLGGALTAYQYQRAESSAPGLPNLPVPPRRQMHVSNDGQNDNNRII